jgi:signal transduction histidine kinase
MATLASEAPEEPFAELQMQNQELLRALAEIRDRHSDIERLNRELQETNRGVLALYTEVDERAVYLTRINELKTKFLSELSHELRTPLNAIRNVSRFLVEGYEGDLNEGQRKGLVLIDDAASGLAEFVDDWLDLAKIEAGRIEVHPSEFTIDDLFGTLRAVFRPMITSTEVELRFDITGDIAPLFADEAKVSQVLRNFISNALKFTERGEVSVTARAEGDDAVFEVSDTGIGIAPADQQRIFEEFTQVENPVQRRVKGTGLGLPLSRKLARLMGGDISVCGRAGGGSTFELRIPVRCSPLESTGGDLGLEETSVRA